MASQLKVDTITGVTTAGSIAVTGEGNSTTTNLQQGLCKAWASLNDADTGSPALLDSFNSSGFTDSGTGHFKINFTNSFNNNDFATTTSSRFANVDVGAMLTDQTTSQTKLLGRAYNSNSNTDFNENMCASMGDLA